MRTLPSRRVRCAGLILALVAQLGLGAACGGHARSASAPDLTSARRAPPATPTFPAGWPYPALEGGTIGPHGVVASDATLASEVGRDVLSAGGNAVDAAIATALALAVVYPAAGNLGGGGFLVARLDGASHALDFRETAPARAARDMFVDAGGKVSRAAREGHRAAGVPGSVAGLHEAWRKLGSKKLGWREIVAPAIRLARDGFVVDEGFARMLDGAGERLKKDPASAALYFPGGMAPSVGSRFANAELAAVLERIAERGAAGFYEGPTAETIVADMVAHDGLIGRDDLARYRAKWRAPLEFTYRGHKVTSMPPPSSGGVVLAMIARIVEGWELADIPWHSAREMHLVAEAMRRAFAARNARLGDPDFVPNPVAELTSDAWAAGQRATIREDRATPSSEIGRPPTSADGPHTTHLSVVDGAGNAAALTTTINWWFGAGVTVAGTGIVLNNEMDDFAARPGQENAFGLVQGEPNAIAPGKRMLSSMSPTVVTGPDGAVRLVLGAAGGPTIITTTFEIMSNVIDRGFDLATAVHAPRFHHQHLPDAIVIEKGGLDPAVRAALGAMGHTIAERDHLADAPCAARAPGGGWLGVPEPRRTSARAAGW